MFFRRHRFNDFIYIYIYGKYNIFIFHYIFEARTKQYNVFNPILLSEEKKNTTIRHYNNCAHEIRVVCA